MAAVIFISAGEASGDLLGADLMRNLKKKLHDDVMFIGIGGPFMIAEGLKSFFPMNELSVMGIIEVLPRLFKIWRRLRQTVDFICTHHPDMMITIDAPGFNSRLAKMVRKKTGGKASSSLPIIHYVAPSVWAWRPQRAKKIAQLVDHLLTLLPFEPRYFIKEGLPTTFVGHPIAQMPTDIGATKTFRSIHKIPGNVKIITLLPGSRTTEITRMLPVFIQALKLICASQQTIHIVIPTLDHLADAIRQMLKPFNLPMTIVTTEEDKRAAYCHSTVALATSGTVALELAAFQVPCVIAYKISPLTHLLVRRLIHTKYICLVNILLDYELIPEYVQNNCTAQNLAMGISRLLEDADMRHEMKQQMKIAVSLLKAPSSYENAGDCASHTILQCLNVNDKMSEIRQS